MKWFWVISAVLLSVQGWAVAVPAETFTYEDLVALIQAKNLKRVEDVLPALPDDLRSNYTLMYQSRALQRASYNNPRAILFGKDAKFILTFIGDQNAFGFETLETIQFRPHERSFDFRQIVFPTIQNGLKDVKFSQQNKTADGRVSCTSCHGSEPRPNWDHYRVWPGAYGGHDDQLEGEEELKYREFVSTRNTSPFYKYLIQGIKPKDPEDVSFRPNLRLSDLIGSLNSLRAMGILERKLGIWQRLGFAVNSLECKFTDEQKKVFENAGRDVAQDIDLGVLFKQVGLSNSDWGTEIFGDDKDVKRPWDHQSGFGYLAENIAMIIVQNLALEGNETLKNALQTVEVNLRNDHLGSELEFLLKLNESIPYLDDFGKNYEANRSAVCPELTRVFVNEYIAKGPAFGRPL